MRDSVRVSLWGTTIGYLGYPPGGGRVATFEYDPEFMNSGIQVSPIHLQYPPGLFRFPDLSEPTFKGVPGFIADSLPDRYGTQLIDIYMAEKGIPPSRITTLDRLLYVANRGMGALEYHPGETLPLQRTSLTLSMLTELADLVTRNSRDLQQRLHSSAHRAAALSLIRVGSSAGGARSKALVAISSRGTILDGTVNHGPDYSYWLLKFDSPENRDRDSPDPQGLPRVEYIYSLIASDAGIAMPRTRLIDDGEISHFLIERFDRRQTSRGLDKVHYCSWAGIAHADRDGVNSYEQLVLLSRQLHLGQEAETQIFRRAVFNILGRNHDDHTKNFGFLMDRDGTWSLSPAFDLTYSYDPRGRWTKHHQTWLQGKNDQFTQEDLLAFGGFCNLSSAKSREIITQTADAFSRFSLLASTYRVPPALARTVESNLRLFLSPRG
ncbi:type II toxin-antitoxin system HipA family toxin [Spirochaeta lutea]|uniref:Toxin HipA n=1 Tax=Spirochaeta lutea TaxID=1480694 RepID=A0A098R0G0_9SPIO|nr:type II toxin-antitoxin system HipA family toxin [Spirochaeta lutea]KGE73419.1 hypothetical protein DC28_03910 [Spirochaeta lutea]